MTIKDFVGLYGNYLRDHSRLLCREDPGPRLAYSVAAKIDLKEQQCNQPAE